MSQEHEQDTMCAEYDFSGGVRGKHYQAYRQGTNLVLLEPDVAAIFKDAATVNAASECSPKLPRNPFQNRTRANHNAAADRGNSGGFEAR
jgi:hypothetical protein